MSSRRRTKVLVGTILGVILAIAVAGYEYQSFTAVRSAVVTWNGIQTDASGNSAWLVEIQNKGNVPIVGISLVEVDLEAAGGKQVTETFHGLIGENNTPPNPFMLESSPLPCCTYGVVFSPVFLNPVSKNAPLAPEHLAASMLDSAKPSSSDFFRGCTMPYAADSAPACRASFQIDFSDGSVATIESPVVLHSP